MQKIIWTCWFQGEENAPPLVQACLRSWREKNPGWQLRCLDAHSLLHYVDLLAHIDLQKADITPASLSDLLRLLVLHEYGGVWVDATLYCNHPLDTWLPAQMPTGFFAFARPASSRALATWFLAAEVGHPLLLAWVKAAFEYWQDRSSTDDYFWVHHQFDALIAQDQGLAGAWKDVPKISAHGPHSIQKLGFGALYADTKSKVNWAAPVFKLSYRYDHDGLPKGCLLDAILGPEWREPRFSAQARPNKSTSPPLPIAQLRVHTQNLGDHLQILAAARLLERVGLNATSTVDRDDEIALAPELGKTRILLNGWFKTNPLQWPPHADYTPLYIGFHIRLFQAPSLISPEAIAHYKTHEPIGCRDIYTADLLNSQGVKTYVSQCLTLSYPRRIPDPARQTEVFVVSRDARICDYLPPSLGPYQFINHYSDDTDFSANLEAAQALLELYKSRAKLIVTSLLHCALPALAMGIPVIMVYPLNHGRGHRSDRERFSSLETLLPIYKMTDLEQLDWHVSAPDISAVKLELVERFFSLVRHWGEPLHKVSGIAPPCVLPPPGAAAVLGRM